MHSVLNHSTWKGRGISNPLSPRTLSPTYGEAILTPQPIKGFVYL
jgi:hypothetical protein